ncbi:MAG: BTAD domain-containing putative transcriptional regulator [Anaerolineae bacterium]|jgi:DNA-binding SARP family transcriptional activator/predicted ATPase/tetratricopeptide (TPR) repeat protein
MSGLRLYLLGPCRLERDGQPLAFDTRKNMALVAYLAMTGQSHSREALITLLWPELEPSRARAGLRRNLSTLKKALGGVGLVVDRQTVGLDPDAGLWLDVVQFRRLLGAWEAHGHPEDRVCPQCLAVLAEAVALCRGDFMEGFGLRDSVHFDEWQFFEAEGLRQELASALERLVQGHSTRGAYGAAIPYARRWLALDPLHEVVHRQLMQLYALDGQRAAALRQYQACSRVLQEELALSPSEETTALYEQIRAGQDRGESLLLTPAPRHNLPAQTTAFVGREGELAEIKARLCDAACRLLTLVGPGGMGKTRLALEAAEALVSEPPPPRLGDDALVGDRNFFEDGVYFVPLAPLDTADALVAAIGQVSGLDFYTGRAPRQQLLDYLRQKHLLLILDNFELVAEILRVAPGVKIVATSREKLNVQGEHLLPVTGMGYPDRDGEGDALGYSGVRLFVERARCLRPGLAFQAEDMGYVARICRLVGGMPLGILLAAGWLELLSPKEICDEIARSLDFLETDLRDLPARQRSIRAVFDHSWNLLSAREQEVFRGLSAFRGGFTREAAQQVTGAALRELMALVNKSLLQRTSAGRYEVHDLLREYAAERLRQANQRRQADPPDRAPSTEVEVRDRHCAYYAALLHQLAPDLKSERQQAAITTLDQELENVRAAWAWATEQGYVAQLDQAMDSLALYWRWRSRHQEGQVAFEQAVDSLSALVSRAKPAAGPEVRVLARLLIWQARLWGWLDGRADQQLERGRALLDRSEMADEDVRQERAFLLRQMGWLAAERDTGRARELCRQSRALYRALGDRHGLAESLDTLGQVEEKAGALDEAENAYQEGLALRQLLGDQKGIARSLMWLSGIARRRGRAEEAVRLARESITLCREIGDRGGVAFGVSDLGQTLLSLGRFAEARALLDDSPAIGDNLGFFSVSARYSLGLALAGLGRYEEAGEQGRAALTLAHEMGLWSHAGLANCLLGFVALAGEAYARATSLFEESAVAFRRAGQELHGGWALAGLGYAFRALDQPSRAGQCLCDALRLSTRAAGQEADQLLMLALPALALLQADLGQKERAVTLWAWASQYPFVAHSSLFEDLAGRQISAVAAGLPPEVVEAARARGQRRDLDAVPKLLAELVAFCNQL